MNRFDFPISGLTSFRELQDTQRIPSETKVVEIRKIAVSPKLHETTGWPVASEAWKLIRQRRIDGEVVILDKDYLDASIIEELPENRAKVSIFDYFENDLGLEIAYAQKKSLLTPSTKNCGSNGSAS